MKEAQKLRNDIHPTSTIPSQVALFLMALMMLGSTTAFACYSYIKSEGSSTSCTESPCEVEEYSPAKQTCGIQSESTGKTCVYEGTYDVTTKVYVNGGCYNEQCSGAVHDPDQDDTSPYHKPKLINCDS
jgi:hypothetical protein